MNFTQYLQQYNIDKKDLDALGLSLQFEKIFNDDSLTLQEKKSKSKTLFSNAFTSKTRSFGKLSEDEEFEAEKELDMEVNSSSQELILKPSTLNGVKLEELKNEIESENALEKLMEDPFYTVENISFTKLNFKPRKPFITSTLQQAASSYLGLNPKLTMGIAQKLYEGISMSGNQVALITYMRTDSLNISNEALDDIRKFIGKNYSKYLPKTPNIYKSKSKNAQEAHEAIRPINVNITPDSLIGKIEPSHLKLYTLIWKNTVCGQMTDQIKEKKSFSLVNSKKSSFNGAFISILEDGWRLVFDY